MAISSLLILVSFFAWYIYAKWYNAVNNNSLNLLGIYPIWKMSGNEIDNTINNCILNIWTDSYQQKFILYFLGVLLIIYIIKWKSLHKFLRLYTLILLIGSLIYSALWFKAFAVHDYYQLINVIAPVFLIITILEYYTNKIVPKLGLPARYSISLILSVMVFISIFHNRSIQQVRYFDNGWFDRKLWVYNVEPYLRKIGISPKDTIISIPDPSPNITLAAFGNPGYTGIYSNETYILSHIKDYGAKYLLICDTAYLHNQLYTLYMSKPIGRYKEIYIFDIR